MKARWHENRHTLVTELYESGAGDEAIIEHRRARLARHDLALLPVRIEAKRHALDEIAARQHAADVKRKEEADRLEAAVASLSEAIQ